MQALLKSYEGKKEAIVVKLKHGETLYGKVVKVDNGMVTMEVGASHARSKVHFMVEQVGSVHT